MVIFVRDTGNGKIIKSYVHCKLYACAFMTYIGSISRSFMSEIDWWTSIKITTQNNEMAVPFGFLRLLVSWGHQRLIGAAYIIFSLYVCDHSGVCIFSCLIKRRLLHTNTHSSLLPLSCTRLIKWHLDVNIQMHSILSSHINNLSLYLYHYCYYLFAHVYLVVWFCWRFLPSFIWFNA